MGRVFHLWAYSLCRAITEQTYKQPGILTQFKIMAAALQVITNDHSGFTDVALVSKEDKKIPANLIILAGSSPCFIENGQNRKKFSLKLRRRNVSSITS